MTATTPQTPLPDASVGTGKPERPKLLEALGSRVLVLTRSVAKLSRKLPIVGPSVGYAEDVFCQWMDPVVAHVERQGLYVLSLVDNQIHKVSGVAFAYVPFAGRLRPLIETILSGQPLDRVSSSLDMVARRGVVGSAADMWVEHEPFLKNKAEQVCSVASRLPYVSIGVHIVRDVSSPILSAASDWLVTHSEVKDKHEISHREEVSSGAPDSDGRESKPEAAEDNRVEANSVEENSPEENGLDASEQEGSAQVEPPAESGDAGEHSGSESNSADAGKGEEAALDLQEKFPEMTVTHYKEEEDDVTDLFNTWGMGGKAISASRLESMRSLSLDNDKKNKGKKAGKPEKPFIAISKSLRF